MMMEMAIGRKGKPNTGDEINQKKKRKPKNISC